LRPAPAVPENVDTVPPVLVHDEHGQFEGLVTPGDILEALAGAFKSDTGAEEPAVPRKDGSWLLSGSILVDETGGQAWHTPSCKPRVSDGRRLCAGAASPHPRSVNLSMLADGGLRWSMLTAGTSIRYSPPVFLFCVIDLRSCRSLYAARMARAVSGSCSDDLSDKAPQDGSLRLLPSHRRTQHLKRTRQKERAV
jgi:hypothetical protein